MWDESFSGVCVFISGGLLVRVTPSLKIQIVEGVFLWNLKNTKIETESRPFAKDAIRLLSTLVEQGKTISGLIFIIYHVLVTVCQKPVSCFATMCLQKESIAIHKLVASTLEECMASSARKITEPWKSLEL